MQQKKVVFGMLGLIAVAAIYYFISLVIQINKKLDAMTAFKIQVNRQLTHIRANGFTLSTRDTEEKHFLIRLDDPKKASNYLTHKGFRVTAEEAQELKGLKLAVNLAYLNDIITFDLYPVTLPENLHAILAQENDKQLLTQFEEMLKRKTFFAHIDIDPSSSTFKGYVKDINETVAGRHELKFALQGFHFSGDVKEGQIVTLTQSLQTIYFYIEGMLERTISGLQHDYALTGPTLHDYQEAYTIAQARINGAPVTELFSEGIVMRTTSSTKKGVAFETFKTKINKIDLMFEKKPLGMENVLWEINISNIDIGMLEAFQKRDLADKKIFEAATKKIDSHPIDIDIPRLSVEKIRYAGKEMDGLTLHSHIDIKHSFDISGFNTDPTHALSKMDADIELSFSNELLTLLKENPEILLFYMTYRPKTISDQNIYNIHLKDGFIQINGKALKRNGKAVRF
jgi:hypothetical protein